MIYGFAGVAHLCLSVILYRVGMVAWMWVQQSRAFTGFRVNSEPPVHLSTFFFCEKLKLKLANQPPSRGLVSSLSFPAKQVRPTPSASKEQCYHAWIVCSRAMGGKESPGCNMERCWALSKWTRPWGTSFTDRKRADAILEKVEGLTK